MGVASDIAGNFGQSRHTLEEGGKTYRLRLIDQDVQAEWEKALYGRECRALKIQREQGLLGLDELAARSADLTTAYRQGEFDMLSPQSMAMLQTPAGIRLLLMILTGCTSAELVRLMVRSGPEVAEKVRLVLADSFPGLGVEPEERNGHTAPNPGAPRAD